VKSGEEMTEEAKGYVKGLPGLFKQQWADLESAVRANGESEADLTRRWRCLSAGRSRPAFILITRDKPAAEPNALRVYGIAEESGVHAVLVEGAQAKHLAWADPGYH
jgi:hypothetical protein